MEVHRGNSGLHFQQLLKIVSNEQMDHEAPSGITTKGESKPPCLSQGLTPDSAFLGNLIFCFNFLIVTPDFHINLKPKEENISLKMCK